MFLRYKHLFSGFCGFCVGENFDTLIKFGNNVNMIANFVNTYPVLSLLGCLEMNHFDLLGSSLIKIWEKNNLKVGK